VPPPKTVLDSAVVVVLPINGFDPEEIYKPLELATGIMAHDPVP